MRYKTLTCLFFLFLLLNFHNSFAQNKLFLCTGYNEDGRTEGTFENWTIQKDGNFMYIFYQSATPINDTLFVTLERVFNRRDSNYYEYDHYYLVPDVSKKWAVNKYTFTQAGNYKIRVYDRTGNELAAPYTAEIDMDEKAYIDMHFTDTWYYEQSSIFFYEKAVGDSMIGKSNLFKYEAPQTKVMVYIDQSKTKTFKTNHFFVSVYTADKCREFINSYTYYVKEDWHWTFVPLYFNKPGKYSVEIYNDDDVFINSAAVEIK